MFYIKFSIGYIIFTYFRLLLFIICDNGLIPVKNNVSDQVALFSRIGSFDMRV